MSPMEYGPQRERSERVPSQPHRVAPVAVESPAAISTVQEIVEAVTERLMESSTTRFRKETRPLKLSVAGLGALVVATCGWGVSQVDTWQESQRNQWAIEAKQLEQDEAMQAHLLEPHVSPEHIEALERKLGEIEEKLDQALKAPKAPKAPKAEDVPVKIKLPSRR